MKKVLQMFLHFLYPPVCGICGKLDKNNLCDSCRKELQEIEKICHRTKIQEDAFDEQISLFLYQGIIKEKLIQYKFKKKPYLYATFGQILLENKKICCFLKNYDIIIPVPISKKRKKERGYNQCELIAKKIAEKIPSLSIAPNIFLKIKDTPMQSKLDKQQRRKNVKQAYAVCNKQMIKKKKILLLDDIYTTGATVQECSKVLKEAGAKTIGVLTIAKD